MSDALTIGPLGPWTHAAIRRCQGIWVSGKAEPGGFAMGVFLESCWKLEEHAVIICDFMVCFILRS